MGDASEPVHEWGRYLRRITRRPGWSVAKLAREARIARQTIFDWIKDGGESVTIASVRAIATAAGDDMRTALMAAANIPQRDWDAEIVEVLNADGLDNIQKMQIIELLERERVADEQLLADLARRDHQRRLGQARVRIDQARSAS